MCLKIWETGEPYHALITLAKVSLYSTTLIAIYKIRCKEISLVKQID